jgi:TolA-binding protein
MPAALEADARRQLEAATALARAKKWDDALPALDAFLGRFGDHPRAESASLMRAECLAAKKDWSQATAHLESHLARWAQSPRTPEALLLLGRSYAQAGDKDRAHDAFARLKTQYPKTDAARQAPRE